MPINPGTKFGPYEIQSLVGSGGMGEVYRARDTRLDRTVAIKILPAEFAHDPDRLQRFQYEARILSSLNHPNVMAIHDIGNQDGVYYLVSEFLEGQTLRQRMDAAPLQQRRLVEYALEVAKGLAAAHEKGVVHRDLKPENVFITRDDRVKILDFGLAKQTDTPSQDGAATMTGPTPTTPGTVMGTVGYMSPEQVRGKVVDNRSDIFSFGAILYEMVSGKRAFKGDSSIETMNAILKEDPPEIPLSATQISPGLDRIIRRCLEKLPERRFQSASDLAFALDSLSGGTSSLSSTTAPVSSSERVIPSRRINWLAWAGVLLAFLVLVIGGEWILARSRPGQPTFTQLTFRSAYIRRARFAPGRTIVYGAKINGAPPTMFQTRTDTIETQPINLQGDVVGLSANSEMALVLWQPGHDLDPGWVPMGRLARAPLGGGATRELLDDVLDADWTQDGGDLAVARRVNGTFRLEFPLGKVLYQTLGYISDLRFSPTGKHIAFLDHPVFGDDRGFVSVIDLEGHRKVLTGEFSSEQGLAWSPRGDEIWFTANLTAEPSVLRAVNLAGKQRIVLAAPIRLQLQDVVPDGRVLLAAQYMRWQLGVVDVKDSHPRDLTAFQWVQIEDISRDGAMILLNAFDTSADNNYRLYIQRTDGAAPVLIGEGAGTSFSFDGKFVLAQDPSDLTKLSIIPTSVGETRVLHAPQNLRYFASHFLPGNQSLLITAVAPDGALSTFTQDINTGSLRPVSSQGKYVMSFFGVMAPGPSPDGKSCIVSDGQGHYWLQPLDGAPAREISSIKSSEQIINWHNDADNLFLVVPSGSDGDIYSLNITTGERKLWAHFSAPDRAGLTGPSFLYITPDGSRYAYSTERILSTLFQVDGLR
jgi:serine/threonine protein kinase/Tol biopolymer transport system component